MSARSFGAGPGGTRRVHRLGKYTLTGVLGEGAMGIVYKALDPHINRTVAIKTIRSEPMDTMVPDVSATVRFRNEAQAAGRLSHPHIVSVYEYGVDGNETFIVMEYVEGQPLTRYVRGGKLWPIEDVLSAMVQLLDALHYAHEQGVLHRDIKPANVILSGTGRVKITDFGIARIDSIELTQKSSVVGSPGYMAPERFTGEPPNRGVDVFSCGVLLYALLTGESPFPGPMDASMYKILYTEPTPPSRTAASRPVPEVFDAIVAKAIAKQPANRYATTQEFRDALMAVATEPIRPLVSKASIDCWIEEQEQAAAEADAAAAAAAVPPPLESVSGSYVPSTYGDQGVASTIPPTGWDLRSLETLQTLLAAYLGPIAKVVVRRTARHCSDIPDLVARLAGETLEPADRKAFIHKAAKAFPEVAEPSGFTGSTFGDSRQGHSLIDTEATLLAASTGSTPLTPAIVEQAKRLLATHIGPIAGLMARQAAAKTQTREQFFVLLVEQAADSVDREKLLEEFEKIGPATPV